MQLLRSFLIAGNFLLAQLVTAQVPAWIPDGTGFKGIPVASYSHPQEGIYTLEIRYAQGFRNGALILHRYNGLFNTQSKPLPVQSLTAGYENTMAICRFRNRTYVAGSFVSNALGIRGVAVWDGLRWSAADSGLWAHFPVHDEISVKAMATFKGKLYAAGMFRLSGTQPLRNFAVFDSVSWSPVPFPKGAVSSLLVQGDTLYAGGSFDSIGNVAAQNLAYRHNDTWHGADVHFPVRKLLAISGGLAACSDDSVYLRLPGGWVALQQGWNFAIQQLDGFIRFGNLMYLSGRFLQPDGSVHHLLQWNGTTWRSVLTARDAAVNPAYPLLLESWQKELWLAGKINGYKQKTTANLLIARPGYSILSGRIFDDMNGDCRSSNGEKGIARCIFSINDGQAYYNSDSLGDFSFPIRSDTVQHVSIYPAEGFQLKACAGHRLSFDARQKDTAWSINYALEHIPMPPLQESGRIIPHSGGKARHGYTCKYTLQRARGTEIHGKVIFSYPAGMRLIRAEPLSAAVGSTFVEWDMEGATQIRVEMEVSHDRFAPGDALRFKLKLPGGAEDSLLQTVVAAYDPNDKQCSPEAFNATTAFLDYHIRFQNLGNDSAVNVFIVDSINRQLPLQFLRVTANSHPGSYNLNYRLQGHAVIWEFRNIMLAPKAVAGDDGSSGFVRFRAGMRSGLKQGDTISNKAYIFFDFQPAVITNTTRTGFNNGSVSGGIREQALHLWPNPSGSADELQLSVPPYTLRRYEVYTADGRLWQQYALPAGTQQWRIPVVLWPAGAYVIRVDYGSGMASGIWLRS